MNQNLKIQENVLLAPLTTLKIGGKARFFVSAESDAEVISAFDFAAENEFDLFVLGGGSNVLISDHGFDGLVLQIAIRGVSFREENDETMSVLVGAGEEWDKIVELSVNKNLQGIECLSGIPGFVGGTPVQNVGAYGQEVSETIISVKCFDRKTQSIVELKNADCRFSYRSSIFNSFEKERFIVLSVKYLLNKGGKPKISYADLQKHFNGKPPTLAETREAVLEIRSAKSMVIKDGDPNALSAGSFFKNPIVSNSEYEMIQERAKKLCRLGPGETLPRFEVDAENVKIPAAWLIEHSGFQKGYSNGKAGISTKHTLALVNAGSARASDILKLKDKIQTVVMAQFDVLLQPEPIFVGFDRG